MLSVDFSYIPWGASLSLPNLSRVFIMRPWWILWSFSALLIWTYFFLFNLFIWWVVLIVPWMLTQSWIDERHLTWCTLHYLFRFLSNILLRMCYVCVYENLTFQYILLLCFNWCELDSLHCKWLLYSWINTYFIFIVFSFVFPPPLFLVVSDLTFLSTRSYSALFLLPFLFTCLTPLPLPTPLFFYPSPLLSFWPGRLGCSEVGYGVSLAWSNHSSGSSMKDNSASWASISLGQEGANILHMVQ